MFVYLSGVKNYKAVTKDFASTFSRIEVKTHIIFLSATHRMYFIGRTVGKHSIVKYINAFSSFNI
jgi:stage III sporulation protein SpoIIIAA